MSEFLRVARSNTDRNVETCGILAGSLSNDRFRITHVLVPKQTGTADSCTMLEEDLAPFEYMDKHELITLGWVRIRGGTVLSSYLSVSHVRPYGKKTFRQFLRLPISTYSVRILGFPVRVNKLFPSSSEVFVGFSPRDNSFFTASRT